VWLCTMEIGTVVRKKAWRKGYEIMVTQFVSVFMVESKGAVLMAGGLYIWMFAGLSCLSNPCHVWSV
jgi:hypothetical protein